MMTNLTVRQWIDKLAALRKCSDSPRLDAELLVMAACANPRAWLIARNDEPLPESAVAHLQTWLAAFSQGMPMAYLTGQQEFWSLPLRVNQSTLIPRPATESLVEWILAQLPPTSQTVLDMGTGSGAIALALQSERPQWKLVATDQSAAALAVARDNAVALQLPVEFLLGSWWEAVLGRRFDCIVSNPPYIAENDPHLSALRHEPQAALTAGKTGLDDLSVIAQGVYDHLNPGGWLIVEHGYDQQLMVMQLLQGAGLVAVQGHSDLSGQDRFVVGKRK